MGVNRGVDRAPGTNEKRAEAAPRVGPTRFASLGGFRGFERTQTRNPS